MKKEVQYRLIAFYVSFFSIAIIIFCSVLYSSTSPEKNIIGTWEEIAWEYEKVEKINHNAPIGKMISENIKKEIIENLIIHEAEVWQFLPDGTLFLETGGADTQPLEWKLKGRGHILKLKHKDTQTEYYKLYKLSDEEMVLYFDSDIHAKGIVKMTLKRIKKG